MLTILVAEDEYNINKLICKNLEKAGYTAHPAYDGEEALNIFYNQHIDLVISDVMMPHTDGISLIKQIRYVNEDIPILLLTALETFMDKEKGFTSGADDYLVKPVSMQEMILHVKALLRRYKIVSENQFVHKSVKLDYEEQSISVDGKIVELTSKEFQLLFKLTSSANRIFTREQLMNEIWGYDSESYERTVDTHIKRLREKIKTEDLRIVTVRSLGYKVVLG